MKILLVHPEDSVEAGPWAATQWNLAVDLGWSGRAVYARQSEKLGFRIVSMSGLLDHEQHRCRIRDLLALGLDQLLDSESIDWWDAYSVHPYPQIEQLLLVSVLAEQIPQHAEIFATRPHFTVSALEILLRETNVIETNAAKIKIFQPGHDTANRDTSLRALFRRYWKAASALRPSQLAEIAFDKWDAGYQLRRHFTPSPKITSTPAILLPSSYGNVTRAQVAYARMLPHRRFLLVVTRPSGRLPLLPDNVPDNVEARSLASYAPPPVPATDAERARLQARWQEVQHDLFEQNAVLRLANRLHVFDGFADFLNSGLRVRDAWRAVFAREPITAVLSADEYNPYTRLPTLLARSRKLRTVFCDHGALNMSFGIRRGFRLLSPARRNGPRLLRQPRPSRRENRRRQSSALRQSLALIESEPARLDCFLFRALRTILKPDYNFLSGTASRIVLAGRSRESQSHRQAASFRESEN